MATLIIRRPDFKIRLPEIKEQNNLLKITSNESKIG